MNIVVLCGGCSNERDVSIMSGKMVAKALRELGHRAVLIDTLMGYKKSYQEIDNVFDDFENEPVGTIGNDAPDLEKLLNEAGARVSSSIIPICKAADIVFLALHGHDGEDGKIQAMFDLLNIRYTGSGSLASAVAMDKKLAKMVFMANNILTPVGITVNRFEDDAFDVARVRIPCVVKPQSGGSSVGTSIVYSEEEYKNALEFAFHYEDNVIVEDYVKGREIDVGVLEGKALPSVEICPKSGFFDYINKYQEGMTDEYTPADVPPETEEALGKAAVAVYEALGLDVYGRMDFILDGDGRIWCLEANTLPGLTPGSLMPKEAAAAGIPFNDFCSKIIEGSLKK